MGGEDLAVHADARSGARDFQHLADRRQVERRRSGLDRRAALVAEAADFVYEILQVRLFVHLPPCSELTHTRQPE